MHWLIDWGLTHFSIISRRPVHLTCVSWPSQTSPSHNSLSKRLAPFQYRLLDEWTLAALISDKIVRQVGAPNSQSLNGKPASTSTNVPGLSLRPRIVIIPPSANRSRLPQEVISFTEKNCHGPEVKGVFRFTCWRRCSFRAYNHMFTFKSIARRKCENHIYDLPLIVTFIINLFSDKLSQKWATSNENRMDSFQLADLIFLSP